MYLNHSKTISAPSLPSGEKLSSSKLVPVAKKVWDHCPKAFLDKMMTWGKPLPFLTLGISLLENIKLHGSLKLCVVQPTT